jgi:MFS transporter, PHS family, inorganic phosphate transporter
MGSIIAQAAIAPLRTRGATAKSASPWTNHVMQIYSLFMFLGIFTTLLIPETARKTLEDLAGEYDGLNAQSMVGGAGKAGSDSDGVVAEKDIAAKEHLPEVGVAPVAH